MEFLTEILNIGVYILLGTVCYKLGQRSYQLKNKLENISFDESARSLSSFLHKMYFIHELLNSTYRSQQVDEVLRFIEEEIFKKIKILHKGNKENILGLKKE